MATATLCARWQAPLSCFTWSIGRVDTTKALSSSKYRSNGIPNGIDVMAYGPTAHPNQIAAFRDGYLWDQLIAEDPNFVAKVAAQDCCLVLTGEISDPPTLSYFRDVIGFLTFCLDAGGVAICDPLVQCSNGGRRPSGVLISSISVFPHRGITSSFWSRETLTGPSGFTLAG
jgi:hypothetical protein